MPITKKDSRLHLRVSSEQAARLKRAADVASIPASDLVRRALDRELAKLAKRYPELAAA